MMRKIFFAIPVVLAFSCTNNGKRNTYECVITSVKEEPKISIHDQMNKTKYTVITSCSKNKFVVYNKYNVGDTVIINRIILEE